MEVRLIDANALLKRVEKLVSDKEWYKNLFRTDSVCRLIEEAPTVDATPVVHGHWIYNDKTGEIRCNRCNAFVGSTFYESDVDVIKETEKYCFNCGAKMDGVSK